MKQCNTAMLQAFQCAFYREPFDRGSGGGGSRQ
jgi:hypothetical protein